MYKIILIVLAFLIAETAFSQYSGSLREVSFIGKVTGKPVFYSIYLPQGYDESDKAYPVVYHLHSLGDNYMSNSRPAVIKSFEMALDLGFIDDVIIVFPDGYENSMWGNSIDSTKLAETNLIEELIPFIDYNYRTIPDREHRMIQGFSMGGFGAAKMIAKYPELFCRAVLYDGGMRTWESLQRGRPQIAAEIFRNSEAHFNLHSPWKYIRENYPVLALDTMFYVSVGDFTSMNKTFSDSLNFFGIPHIYVRNSCGHDLECLLDKEWLNAAEYYSSCFRLATDINARVMSITTRSNSLKMLSINYSMESTGKAKIELTDAEGKLEAELFSGYNIAGNHRMDFNLSFLNLKKGVYRLKYYTPDDKIIRQLISID